MLFEIFFAPIFLGLLIGGLVAWFLHAVVTVLVVLAALVAIIYLRIEFVRCNGYNGNEMSYINGVFTLFAGSIMIGAGAVYGIFIHPEWWGMLVDVLKSGANATLRR